MNNRDDTVYMPGAEPFEFAGGEAGILLMHGFSGSCSEVRALGRQLHEAGFGIMAPALAGHGTSPRDLARVSLEDFFSDAEAAFFEATRRYARVYIVGLSMGGTLGLHLAARHQVTGLVTISTPVFMSRLFAWTVPLARTWMPGRHVISNYAAWRGEVVGYRNTPLSSLGVFLNVLAIVRQELPSVTGPLLVIHGSGDRTVPVANARFIASHVASAEKTVRIYQGGRHLLTLPPFLAATASDIVQFLRARENAPRVTSAAMASEGAEA